MPVEPEHPNDRTVEKLLRQQAALAAFGTFAFRETDLGRILTEAARICALSLGVPFCKICRYRADENDLLVEAGCGWNVGVVGRVVSQADESSPQGRAYITGEPVIIRNLQQANNLELPRFYPEHGIISTVDVLIPATDGAAYGVLEIDSPTQHLYDEHDINFLTGFANVLAEAVATSIRNEAIRSLLEERNLLAEEMHHRVRNNLYVVGNMLDSFTRTSSNDPERHVIGAIARRVTTLAKVYDSLLGVGLSRTINLGEYLEELCGSLPDMQAPRMKPIELSCRTETILLTVDAVTTVGMIVAELVTNSYNHAFPDRAGKVSVALSGVDDFTKAILTVSDDGIGLPVDVGSTRHGVGLVRRLVSHIAGTFDVSSGLGTIWTVTFPISNQRAPALIPTA
jgi:two-component sensor histidine kinase/putative methionine-R-sulfoxide reductase with GAF domain